MLSDKDCEDILSIFPEVAFAMAYGSGVVEQAGYDYSLAKRPDSVLNSNNDSASLLPMLDFIFVVEDSEAWHTENINRNPSHYSSVIKSPRSISYFQDQISANFWFNAYIPMNILNFQGRLMKYGVINKKNFIEDLTNWTQLYAAGRLHKPVRFLKVNPDLWEAIYYNYAQAVSTSLLLLPETFKEVDLYMTIASLSYTGDPRMFIGENPKKVRNLVTPIVHHYRRLYQPFLSKVLMMEESFSSRGITTNQSTTRASFSSAPSPEDNSAETIQNISIEQKRFAAARLPLRLRALLSPNSIRSPPRPLTIRNALAQIVSRSAGMQSAKGLITVGVLKSSVYILNKMKKRFPILASVV